MSRKSLVWLVLFSAAALLTLAEAHWPYLPGDVALARLVQALLPPPKDWAKVLSSTAEMPWVLILVGMTALFSWRVSGWRAAGISVLSFMGLFLLGLWLGPVVSQPRPSPWLIEVTGSPAGSAFPSLFALRYASTAGFVAALACIRMKGIARRAIVVLCAGVLIAGMLARLALGAHWPSDIGLSYLIGFLWVALLLRFL